MRRTLVGSLVGLLLLSSSVFAADDDTTTTVTPAMAAAATTLARPDLTANLNVAPRIAARRRPLALPSLYAGSVFLQSYDAYSTLSALRNGGTEANPLMKGITKSPVAFIGLKAGVTMMSIMAAERMWKDNNRVRAVLTMVATNGFMAAVAAHNTAVLHRVQQ
ncbi:MAG TPA: DUF5658 family protein [Vicinamibacterales bacterium]